MEIKFYCDSCEEHQPVEIEPLKKDDLNGDIAWGDILCKECHFVIATITSEEESIVRLVLEREVIDSLRGEIKELKFIIRHGIRYRLGDSALIERILHNGN